MDRTTLLRVAAWLCLLAIVGATLVPIGWRPHGGVLPVQAERLIAFLACGFLFAAAYPRHLLIVAVAFLCGTVLLEVLQELTPTRHGHVMDLGAKLMGVAVGIVIGRVLVRR